MKHTIATTTGITLAMSAILLLNSCDQRPPSASTKKPEANHQPPETPEVELSPNEMLLTSADGREIIGTVQELSKSDVQFIRSDGKLYVISLDQLSKASIPRIHENWLLQVKKGQIGAPTFATKPVDFTFDCFYDLGIISTGWKHRGDNGRYSAVFEPYRYLFAGHSMEYFCSGKRDVVTNIKLSLWVRDRDEADPTVVDHYTRMCERFFADKMGTQIPDSVLEAIKLRQNVTVEVPGASVSLRSKDFVRGVGYQQSLTVILPISTISPD